MVYDDMICMVKDAHHRILCATSCSMCTSVLAAFVLKKGGLLSTFCTCVHQETRGCTLKMMSTLELYFVHINVYKKMFVHIDVHWK